QRTGGGFANAARGLLSNIPGVSRSRTGNPGGTQTARAAPQQKKAKPDPCAYTAEKEEVHGGA
ncbi:hypothetical protein HK405_013921, partial [Cladochytrium tenue]